MSTAAERAAAERKAQGLATPAAPTGDHEHDARLAAAYRDTATMIKASDADRPRETVVPNRQRETVVPKSPRGNVVPNRPRETVVPNRPLERRAQ